MPIFSISKNNLQKIKELSFKNEKREIQKICENNLQNLFNLEFVKSEFSLNHLRIDTLAFDNETNSFVILEYKKDKNFSVVDQGIAYLALLLNNKADFILEFNESKNKSLKRNDVDWEASKVIFVSPQFTKYQRQSINFRDFPIELWEIKKYENNSISFEQIKPLKTTESITKITPKSEEVKKVTREVKLYSEDYHLEGKPEEIVEKYEKLRDTILELGDNIEVRPRKDYIGFIANTNFVDVHPKKSKLTIWINLKKGELDDPKNIARDMSNTGHHGNGDYEISLKTNENLDYIVPLIRQAYEKHS